MAFDETYNEPESTEVLVKSLDPEHPAQLHYAHAGDAGADLITTVDVTSSPSSGHWCPPAWPSPCLRATWRWCIRVPAGRQAGHHRAQRAWHR